MKQKTVTVLDPAKEQEIPCQLGIVSNRPCSILCAFEHGCPVFNLDSHDLPLIKRLQESDLDPVRG